MVGLAFVGRDEAKVKIDWHRFSFLSFVCNYRGFRNFKITEAFLDFEMFRV
jgi:hypothetical protein